MIEPVRERDEPQYTDINAISSKTLENSGNAVESFESLEKQAEQLDGLVKQYYN